MDGRQQPAAWTDRPHRSRRQPTQTHPHNPSLSLDVIYGDTDSIMINTAVPSRDEFDSPALLLGDKEERESPAAQKVRLSRLFGLT